MDALTKVHCVILNEDLMNKLWKNSVIEPPAHTCRQLSTNRSSVQTWSWTITTENNERRWRQSEKPAEAPLHGPYRGTGLRAWMRNHHQHRVTFREANVGYVVSPHYHYYCDFVSLINLLEFSLTSSRRNPNKVRTLWRRCWKRRTNHPSKQSFPYFAFFVHDRYPVRQCCCRTFLGNRGRANLVFIGSGARFT